MANAISKRRRKTLISDPVFRALAISLIFHLGVFGAWKLGVRFHLDRFIPFSSLLSAMQQKLLSPPKNFPPKQQQNEMPTMFVEVDPSLMAKEAPKDAKFYGAVNTLAANPEPATKSDLPKIDGKEREFLKTTENQKLNPQPLRPSPTVKPAEPEETQEVEAKPKSEKPVGDLAFAKPEEHEKKNDGKSESKKGDAEKTTRARPRTLAEAKRASTGDKSKIDGGAPRHDISASLGVKGSIVGDYDQRFIEAVRQRWDSLLEQVSSTTPGKVVLEFRLHHDGRVTDVNVRETAVNEMQTLLCEKAIQDPSPYPKWPTEMRNELKGDHRDVTFTFYYLAQ